MAATLSLDDIRELSRMRYGTKGETYFVDRSSGSDSNTGKRPTAQGADGPFKNMYAASLVATDGDTIVWDGEHDFTFDNPDLYDTGIPGFDHRTLTIPAGVKFIGGSRSTARINFDGSPIKVAVGGNAILSDFTLFDVSASGSFVQPIGWTPLTPGPSTGVEVHRIRVVADSDGAYHSGSAAQALPGYWKYFDSIFETKYDASTILGDEEDQQVDYFDCDFIVRGPSTVSPTTICRAVTAQQGITRLKRCRLITETDGSPTTIVSCCYARAGTARVSRIELADCTIQTRVPSGFVSGGGTLHHLQTDAGCEIVAVNVAHDRRLNSEGTGTISIFGDGNEEIMRVLQSQTRVR